MKTITILSLALSLSFGFAAIAHAGERGQVQVPASAAKAVVVGPTAISAYSEFSGAKLFVVDVVTGTDRDCQGTAQSTLGAALAADKIETLSVGAGQVACVVATSARDIELLWKAQKVAPAPTMLARR